MTAVTATPRTLLAGASRYLGSVLFGVLFAPVVPDIAVDLFGGSAQPWRNPLLRFGAVLLVLAACVVVYQVQLAIAARRARRAGYVLDGIGPREVMVLPVSVSSGYQRRGRRTGDRSVIEWLVDTSRPQVVVVVGTPETREVVAAMREAMTSDGMTFECVEIRDAGDPDIAVADAQRLVLDVMTTRELTGRPCYVDITGGSLPMSLGMLRTAALLGAECTYVASRFENRQRVPGSQQGRAFDPVTLLTPTAP